MELQPGVWRVSAGISVHDWADAFGRNIDLFPGVATLGGLVMAQLGRVPQVGDIATLGNVQIQVEQMDRRRITELTIRLTDQTQTPTDES